MPHVEKHEEEKRNTPKRKTMSRPSRLASGKKWLESYTGKLCAVKELRMLGIPITEEYENQIKRSMENLAKALKRRKELKEKELSSEKEPSIDETFAFIAGYTSCGFPYGITHEEMESLYSDFKDLDLNESAME